MSERIYIGARYVPLIMGEWDNTNSYEPLSIVTYNGDSYTSRQGVPVGIPITNTTYWAKSADYNAQVAELAAEIDGFDSRLDDIEADNWVTTDRINDSAITTPKIADSSITSAKLAASTLELIEDEATEKAIEYAAPLHYYKDFGYLAIGDGWTAGANVNINDDYVTKLANLLGISNVYNYSASGSGFCKIGTDDNTFTTLAASAINTLTSSEKDNVHLVTVMGGLNDWRDGGFAYADMRDAASALANTLKSNFPNAYILFIPMCMPGYGTNGGVFQFERGIISGIKGHARAAWVSGAWSWLWGESTWINADNLTPTANGHSQLAYDIYKRMLNGGSTLYYDRNYTPTFLTGYSSDFANGNNIQFLNGMINMQGWNISYSNSIAANTNTQIGSIPAGACPLVDCIAPIYKANEIVGIIRLTNDGKIYIRATDTLAAGAIYASPISYIPCGKALH